MPRKVKPPHYLTEQVLVERGLTALMEALGPVETLRFLSRRQTSRVESSRRHRRWQATLEQKKFYDQVFKP